MEAKKRRVAVAEEYGRLAFTVAAGLSFPRKTGSAGERAARARVKEALAGAGLAVSEEFFHCSDYPIRAAARWAMVPTGVLIFLSALFLSFSRPLPAALLAVISLFPAAYFSFRSRDGFSSPRRVMEYHCANIIGRFPGEPAAGKTVLLMAHYDSKSQLFPIWLRIGLFMFSAMAGALLIALIMAGAVLMVINKPFFFQPFLVPAAALLLLVDLSFLLNTAGNLSDGALDNATGVGIITELGKRLAEDRPLDFDLRVVATAAEEIGLCGAVAYLREHRKELDPRRTLILNFDGCGRGRAVHILASYGLPPRRLPESLRLELAEICAENGLALRLHSVPFGMATDLMPFQRAGYTGIDFIGPALKSHSPEDRITLVSEENLGDYVRLALDLIRMWTSR